MTVSNQAAQVFPDVLSTNQVFTATVTLPAGTNLVSVLALDSSGNLSSNRYAIVVTGDSEKACLYDANGNCTNVSTVGTNTVYEWDAENRLHAINIYVTNTAMLQRSEFTYDGFSHWVQIIEKTNGTVASTKRFVWCGSELCQERDSTNGVTKRFYPEGEEIGDIAYYFARDRLGSVREMVSGTTIYGQYDYDPYGKRTTTDGGEDSDFGFAGYYYHAPSGLYLTVYRPYDPNLGRWINRDPIEEKGGLNLYEYVANDPLNYFDPLGLVGGSGANSGSWTRTANGGWNGWGWGSPDINNPVPSFPVKEQPDPARDKPANKRDPWRDLQLACREVVAPLTGQPDGWSWEPIDLGPRNDPDPRPAPAVPPIVYGPNSNPGHQNDPPVFVSGNGPAINPGFQQVIGHLDHR